jgi:hypothetical protein
LCPVKPGCGFCPDAALILLTKHKGHAKNFMR